MSVATLHINLTSIGRNWNFIKNLARKPVETSAVLKANAYGLGIEPIASHLFREGVNTFFVSSVDEAIELRKILTRKPNIYYLNGYSANESQAINEYNIMPVLNSIDQIENFRSETTQKSAALQIDIGMNRLGLQPFEVIKAKYACKSLNIRLILGHLSSADVNSDPANAKQLKLFSELSSFFPHIPKSLAATGGIILGKKYHFDLTRPGIGIFGGKPFEQAKNVVSINLPVLQVKDIRKGDGIGYNHSFISGNRKRIAIVASGYADGFSRQLSNSGMLYAENIKCPIVGRVSMDLITVDVSNAERDPITLSALGPNQTIDNLAEQSSTIGYEILTSLGSRYKRVYHY